jgi:hypothetical protein
MIPDFTKMENVAAALGYPARSAVRTDITRRLATAALREYLDLRAELGALEAREAECTCDAKEFHRCDLCTETRDKAHRLRGLMELWGDNWAVVLDQPLKALEAR